MEEVGQLLVAANDAHAASAAAGRRFYDHRESRRFAPIPAPRPRDPMIPSEPGRIGTPSFFMVARAFSFSPISRVTSGGGPMNLMSAGLADFGEVGVLAQQPIAGMDGVDIGDLGRADYRGNVEVAFLQARRPDADGFIGKADVQANCGRPRCRWRPP